MPFYEYITEKREDSDDLKKVMEDTASDLLLHKTDDLKPGMLLGLIQSGKTRAFTGVLAKCFDNGFDVAVVFTKNSVALVSQTINRLKSEFEKPIASNKLYVWDIVKLQPGAMTGFILGMKQIIVVKKESKNMDRLLAIFDDNKILRSKNVVIIDDEADQGSVSFVADKESDEGIDLAKVSKKVSEFRTLLKGKNCYLQVTATPYSLYLQPESLQIKDGAYAPLRPAFTHILNAHPAYIGGEYYFEESMKEESPASHLHVNVDDEELGFLNGKSKTTTTYDQRIVQNVLLTNKIEELRKSIITFLVGGSIRQKQEESADEWAIPYHCAFVLHTSTNKKIHAMQKHLVEAIVEGLQNMHVAELEKFIESAYNSLKFSVNQSGFKIPFLNDIANKIHIALENKFVGIIEVNSEQQMVELLGSDGQLRLDNPFNIFVGGQSLDRGITINHLIGFFYGRNPGKFQMDTVLQHSRMYGSRDKKDLAVTRFYTSARIYDAMRRMHWFDKDLREDFLTFGTKAMVRFVSKLGNQIVPAGPNKLKASSLLSFKALSRLLPIGFQTKSQTDIKKTIEKIDHILNDFLTTDCEHFEIPIEKAVEITKLIETTFVYEPKWGNEGLNWDTSPFIRAIEIASEKNKKGVITILFKTEREAGRLKKANTSFGDAPDDGKTDLPQARGLATNGPVLILLKQKGREVDGWRNAPFYWPVLVMPLNMPNYVYCED
jgi:hypothetical protein